MALDFNSHETAFTDFSFGFSALRLLEHIALGQVNPFGRPVTSVRSPSDAAELIDIVRYDEQGTTLTGFTLADVETVGTRKALPGIQDSEMRFAMALPEVRALVADVVAAAKKFATRRAARNLPAPFLPSPASADLFGVAGLRSRLAEYLAAPGRTKAHPQQWQGTLKNLSGKGLREEELRRSGVIDWLADTDANAPAVTATDLASAIDFATLRLSVIPNTEEARSQLRFEVVPERKLAKIKGEAKPQQGQQRRLRLYDRVMGYRIEEVAHAALWGNDQHLQTVTFDGRILRDRATRRAVFDSPELAMARAEEHAREVLPKLRSTGKWSHWSWTGGAEYREWLITLPWYPASFFSNHFAVRNVLAHLRCDVREGGNGEKVLLLQEAQSDWSQEARRQQQGHSDDEFRLPVPPFLTEWPSLVIKLALLHAAQLGVDAVAWIRGEHQAHRYKGLGAAGLRELYDRTLPREANRALKPFGRICESMDVYVPANFGIRRVEEGYAVHAANGNLLGVAPSMTEARELMPDGAHELLWAVHGVRLDVATRAAISKQGFYAWG